MRNIKLIIQYDGTNYCGWQSQKNGIAIQDVIEKSLKRVMGERIRIIGSGRTDSGVHARGQTANFYTKMYLSLDNIRNGLNKNLPDDIVITEIEEVDKDFHAQFDSKSKVYRYTFTDKNPISPFDRNYVTRFRHDVNLSLMKKEAKSLIGRHDFSAFQGSKSKRIDAVRTIKKINIRKNGKFTYIDIESDGFLYNMARNIIGTLIDIGRGRFGQGSMKRILKSKDRKKAGPTAPAKGLCLMRVNY